MARIKKPSGRLSTGPFTAGDIARALKALGAKKSVGGNHQEVWEHPDGWKVPVSQAWTSIRKGDPIFRGIARTTGVGDKRLLQLLNGQ